MYLPIDLDCRPREVLGGGARPAALLPPLELADEAVGDVHLVPLDGVDTDGRVVDDVDARDVHAERVCRRDPAPAPPRS